MKEREPILTKQTQNTYSKGGDIFMAGEGNGVNRIEEAVPRAQRTSEKPVVASEKVQAARKSWAEHYAQKGIDFTDPKNPLTADERGTVEMAIRLGYSPETVTSKGVREVKAKDVVANSLLSREDRLKKAKEILGIEKFDEDEEKARAIEEAIIKAHEVGGEEGKDKSKRAGVYNYTREQLAEKARILEEAGFGKEQRRALIEAGIAAEPVSEADFPDPVLHDIVVEINDEINSARVRTPAGREVVLDQEFIAEQLRRVHDLRDRRVVNWGQAGRLLNSLNAWTTETRIAERQERQRQYEERELKRPEGFWQTLHEDDFELLRSNLQDGEGRYIKLDEFVNKWFDTLYSAAGAKDPSQSPVFEGVQRADQEASIFLSMGTNAEERETNSEKLAYLSDIFETRIRLLTMNWGAISSKNIESIQKGSFGLRAHGLLAGAKLGGGYTGVMFNRITELLEDERLKAERGHLTPELANRIQEMVKEETLLLKRNGVGMHAGKSEKDIERAIKSAYDILVCSQRMHVIAARGKHLLGADAFFSDAGAAFKAFNPETFISEKWGMFTLTDERFLEEVVQKSLADEWIEDKRKTYQDISLTPEQKKELGHILFRTMGFPPDFFSSGKYRINGMKKQLQNYFEHRVFLAEAQRRHAVNPAVYPDPETFTAADWAGFRRRLDGEGRSREFTKNAKDQAENFGLFIRLKTALDKDEGKEIAERWQKIQQYRPEEIIRLLREKYAPAEMAGVNGIIFGAEGYDEFKRDFGAVLRTMREMGFRGEFNGDRSPEQIDFADMTPSQRLALVAALGGGASGEAQTQRVEQIYTNMKRYIEDQNLAYRNTGRFNARGESILTTKGTIFDKDYRFADWNEKTLATDDILLGDLEVLNKSQKAFGMLELSKKWSNDSGGDAYVRNMNDLASSHIYAEELVAFIKELDAEEKFKHANEAAKKTIDYNGREGQAKVVRHTIIPFIGASMSSGFFDALGIEKLPFGMKMTKTEDLYGHFAKTLTQEKRHEMFDKIESLLEAAMTGRLEELENEREANMRKLNSGDYENEEERLELVRKIEEYPLEVEKAKKKGEKYRLGAEELLRITGTDRFKQKAVSLVIFLLIGMFGEGIKLAKPDLKS